MKTENPALTRQLAGIMNLHPKRLDNSPLGRGGIDLSLARINQLLAKLGDPQKKMPPTFHIAGTNGKGSVFANLCSILQTAGLSYHGYSSPHLVRFNERIILHGKEVSDDVLMAALQEVMDVNGDDEITFFELTTAVAFLLFARQPADFLVCEVGLGGRLDSTNVITGQKMVIVTPIDMDHQEFLGDTLEKIAFEKSGIITVAAATNMVSARQLPAVSTVLEQQAKLHGKKIHMVEYQVVNGDLLLRGEQGKTINLGKPGLLGAHQYTNAAVAAKAAMEFFKVVNRPITDDVLRQGIANTTWPARLQSLPAKQIMNKVAGAGLPFKNEAIAGDFPGGMWLDGCHNPAGARALVAWLQSLPAMRTAVLFAILNNRSAEDFLAAFESLDKEYFHFFPTSFPGDHHTHAPEHLKNTASQLGFVATMTDDWRDGLKIIGEQHYQRVIICGSLYLAGQVLTIV